MIDAIYYISLIILGYFAILWTGYIFFLVATFRTIIKKYKEATLNQIMTSLNTEPLLPITIIVPAYNEAKRIFNTMTSLLNLEYKKLHIIVVNDGSTDNTLSTLMASYDLIKVPPAFKEQITTGKVNNYYISSKIPQLTVIDKAHSPYGDCGADCINAALNICKTPLYVTLDADTIVEKEALTRLLFTFLITPHCVAVGGDIYVPDTSQIEAGAMRTTHIPSNLVLGVQVVEYLRSFLYGREGWSLIGGALCHPGAFSLLETKAVLDVGGYDAANFSYDADVIMQLHQVMRDQKFPYTIAYAPSAIAWSEEPRTLKALWRQRSCWQRGLLRSLSRHKKMVLNPAYGVTGLIAFPYYILYEIFGPVVEAISYLMCILALTFNVINWSDLAWLMLLAWTYMLFITMSCAILSLLTYNKYHTKWSVVRIFALTLIDMGFYRLWRAFCALFSSMYYLYNRLRGRSC